jgi:hypothetical protein
MYSTRLCTPCSGLVGEAKVHVEGRVDEALPLAVVVDIGSVVIEELHVVGIEVDNVLVGVDALGRDRLGEDGDAVVDCDVLVFVPRQDKGQPARDRSRFLRELTVPAEQDGRRGDALLLGNLLDGLELGERAAGAA